MQGMYFKLVITNITSNGTVINDQLSDSNSHLFDHLLQFQSSSNNLIKKINNSNNF